MKRGFIVLMMVVLIMFVAACAKTAYASSSNNTIRLSFTVIGSISLDIDESNMPSNSDGLQLEAFSELKDHGIMIDKLTTNNKNLWLFTKTE